MDKLTKYQQIIQQVLQEYAAISSQDPEIETQLIFDIEHHHYQLVNVGWKNQRRVYGCFLHLDIQDDKVWLQHNGTEVNYLLLYLTSMGIAITSLLVFDPKQEVIVQWILREISKNYRRNSD